MSAKGKFAQLLSVGTFTSNLLMCLLIISHQGPPPDDLLNQLQGSDKLK